MSVVEGGVRADDAAGLPVDRADRAARWHAPAKTLDDVLTRNNNVGLMMKVGETTVETWTYDRGANPAMVVTIVDGHIKSIDRQK